MKIWHLSTLLIALCACDGAGTVTPTSDDNVMTASTAAITAVNFTGEPDNYTFIVTIESPDTGCNQYADWWEVFNADGRLIYRRVLAHSHVDEQPFTRSGGPVNIEANETIFVRAHMNNSGYGDQVFTGSIDQGFTQDSLDASFAANLETTEPLPDGCAF